VFKLFDLNSDGTIGKGEMYQLGQMRRKLGQKGGEWTHAQNDRLFDRIDSDGDGKLQMKEFVTFFDKSLPLGTEEFRLSIKAFTECAELYHKKGHKAPPAPVTQPAGAGKASPPHRSRSPPRVARDPPKPKGGRVSLMKAAIAELADEEEESALQGASTGPRTHTLADKAVPKSRAFPRTTRTPPRASPQRSGDPDMIAAERAKRDEMRQRAKALRGTAQSQGETARVARPASEGLAGGRMGLMMQAAKTRSSPGAPQVQGRVSPPPRARSPVKMSKRDVTLGRHQSPSAGRSLEEHAAAMRTAVHRLADEE